MPITLHHLNHSRSQRILWLLEELGVEYVLKKYDRVDGRAPAKLKEVHSLGKSPVLEDGDITLIESGTIVDYLAYKYGGDKHLVPERGTPEYPQYSQWLHFAEGTMMTPLIVSILMGKVQEATPFIVKPVANGINTKVRENYTNVELGSALQFIEERLSKSEWFAGDRITGADFMMSFPIESIVYEKSYLANPTITPNICKWMKRIQERPAYLKALEKGGDYKYDPKNEIGSPKGKGKKTGKKVEEKKEEKEVGKSEEKEVKKEESKEDAKEESKVEEKKEGAKEATKSE